MPTNADSINSFVVQRGVNLSNSAEGPLVPPRLLGDFRVYPPTGFSIVQQLSNNGQDTFVFSWTDVHPTDASNVDHYAISVTGVGGQGAPVQVASSSKSPCTVTIPSTVAGTLLTFGIQTVLKTGLHSDLIAGPTTTAYSGPVATGGGGGGDGAWTAFTYLNSYADSGGATQAGQYMKDRTGRVWFRGQVNFGTANTSMATLPVGYRPAANLTLPVFTTGALSGGSACRMSIDTSGNCPLFFASGAFFSLDCVSFSTL